MPAKTIKYVVLDKYKENIDRNIYNSKILGIFDSEHDAYTAAEYYNKLHALLQPIPAPLTRAVVHSVVHHPANNKKWKPSHIYVTAHLDDLASVIELDEHYINIPTDKIYQIAAKCIKRGLYIDYPEQYIVFVTSVSFDADTNSYQMLAGRVKSSFSVLDKQIIREFNLTSNELYTDIYDDGSLEQYIRQLPETNLINFRDGSYFIYV